MGTHAARVGHAGHSPAIDRFPCPGCGRLTAVHHIGGYLWSHDRWVKGNREHCPGTYYMPGTGTWTPWAQRTTHRPRHRMAA